VAPLALTADQVRAALRTGWHRALDVGDPIAGGMNSATWTAFAGAETYVAKVVPAGARAQFVAGLAVAAHLDAAGIRAGAPVRAADGALTVPVAGGALALLKYVDGRELDRHDPVDQQFWGDVLGTVHRALLDFDHPNLARFHRVRPDAVHLGIEPWVRPAVTAAVAAVARLSVTDQLTYGVLHGDPAPEAFRLDPATGALGLIDWGSAVRGPLAYDAASAVMYAGGPAAAGELLDGYLAAGPMARDELDSTLPTMLRFRYAVQADYFAYRLYVDDRTGIADPAENHDGLCDARAGLEGCAAEFPAD
jgi:Ser/Thr protein kinase RdoA (MazF antagonist)